MTDKWEWKERRFVREAKMEGSMLRSLLLIFVKLKENISDNQRNKVLQGF